MPLFCNLRGDWGEKWRQRVIICRVIDMDKWGGGGSFKWTPAAVIPTDWTDVLVETGTGAVCWQGSALLIMQGLFCRGPDDGFHCCIRVLMSVSFSTSVCGGSYHCADGLSKSDIHASCSQPHGFKTTQDEGWLSNDHSPLKGGRESFLTEITSLSLSVSFQTFSSLYYFYRLNLSGSTFSNIISFRKCRWGIKNTNKSSKNPTSTVLCCLRCIS